MTFSVSHGRNKMDKELLNKILVVDDTETNIDILVEALDDLYEISVALDGETALEICEDELPDLILLDIMMPGISGYDVIERLKADDRTKDIPVIFLSAMSETEDKTKGLGLGAVDYMTKPFELAEVHARIKTHLSLLEAKRDLERSYTALKEAEGMRDALYHMVIHDLNSPLTSVAGYSTLLTALLKQDNFDKVPFLEYVSSIEKNAEFIRTMIMGILDLSKLESGDMPIELKESSSLNILKSQVNLLSGMASNNKVNLSVDQSSSDCSVIADESLLSRVMLNLISNAIKHTKRGTDVTCRVDVEGNRGVLVVEDNGPGIPKEYQDKVFDKFFQVEARSEGKKYGVGLGLAFCKMAVDAMNGKLWVESEEGIGSEFKVAVPIRK